MEPKEPVSTRHKQWRKDGKMNSDNWRTNYRWRLAITDAVIVFWSVFGVQLIWLGSGRAYIDFAGSFKFLSVSYTLASTCISLVWIALLAISGSRKAEVVGSGVEEYRKVAVATFRMFALLSATAFLFQIQLARGYVLLATPLGLFFLLLGRWLWRQWLVSERARGRYMSRAIIVGSQSSTIHIGKKIAKNPSAGYLVLGAFLSRHSSRSPESIKQVFEETGIPVLGSLDNAVVGMREVSADTLIIASADDLNPEDVRHIGWQLRPGLESLVVAPSILDVSGPRIHIRPLSGLPLMQIETPTISGASQFIKRLIDLVASLVSLIILSPFFLLFALLIKTGSPGPVLFAQERIGRMGKPFKMYKFRTMTEGSDRVVADMQKLEHSLEDRPGNEVLFKLKDDPRITKSGKWMRRYSIDELPQLLNVFLGEMSLVGPRPPLENEVSQYDEHVKRRFLAKPGMTGLWQVSGRSDLTWEESVRADLMYVENWSLFSDLVILWRTGIVVITGRGAY